ncbi:MAG: hypothetical protein RLZZ381_1211 [Cyanobacteriota bacterium]|jgi:hypothetical protein
MNKPPSPNVVVAIDLGASLSKVAAIDAKGHYSLLAAYSDVAQTPVDHIKQVESKFWGERIPEARTWVVTSEGAFVTGEYARNHFRGRNNLKLSKLDEAVPKILSLLWILSQKYNHLGNSFGLKLGVLLPSGECAEGDIRELKERLIPALKSFDTPTGKLKLKITPQNLEIKPEGAGIYVHRRLNMSQDALVRTRLGILGIGYRNTNLLVSVSGSVSDRDRHTCDLGFSYLISAIKILTGSAFSESDLAKVVVSAGWDINRIVVEQFLQQLGKPQRLDSLIESIEKSQADYLMQLRRWFRDVQAHALEAVAFYGGTTDYLYKPLAEYFKAIDDVFWHKEFQVSPELLSKAYLPKDQQGLDYRFADPWCFLAMLCTSVEGFGDFGINILKKEEAHVKVKY